MEGPTTPIPPLEPLELYSGMSFGERLSPRPPFPALGAHRPREVLEELLRQALAHEPCHVCFSGGRDSSALLALATHVARRDGLPEPVPLTARYPGCPAADENDWQELVIGHLGLRDWTTFDVTDEGDVLGEAACEVLRRFGVTGLAPAHTLLLHARCAGGGSMVTGTGGDEVFAPGVYRRQSFRLLARTRPRRRVPWELAFNALPLAARRRIEARWTPIPHLAWLRPDAQRQVVQRGRRSMRLTTSYAADVLHMIDTRGYERVCAVLSALAGWAGVTLVEPFFDPRFMRALALETPEGGYVDRTDALEALFGDLLPATILRRTSKASFNEVLMGPRARSFVRHWDGSGIDAAIADPVALKAAWEAPHPDVRSLSALQQAWLTADRARS